MKKLIAILCACMLLFTASGCREDEIHACFESKYESKNFGDFVLDWRKHHQEAGYEYMPQKLIVPKTKIDTLEFSRMEITAFLRCKYYFNSIDIPPSPLNEALTIIISSNMKPYENLQGENWIMVQDGIWFEPSWNTWGVEIDETQIIIDVPSHIFFQTIEEMKQCLVFKEVSTTGEMTEIPLPDPTVLETMDGVVERIEIEQNMTYPEIVAMLGSVGLQKDVNFQTSGAIQTIEWTFADDQRSLLVEFETEKASDFTTWLVKSYQVKTASEEPATK